MSTKLPTLAPLPPITSPIDIGGISGTYTGDPSLFPEITGPDGIPIPIAPARPNPTTTQPSTPGYDPLSKGAYSLGGAIGDAVQKYVDPRGPIGSAVGQAFWDNFYTSRALILVIGVILVAAGVFSFKQTQVILKGATKKVAEGAA